MSPNEALARLLAAFGVPERSVPVDPQERAAQYRSHVAGRRALIVLDNASAAEHVRPLLPGIGPAVIVTSRDSLPGLVAREGAHRLEVDLLSIDDGVALLRRLIGTKVESCRAAAVELAESCARLPLALRVAAELAMSRPATPLAELVTELSGYQRRFELLEAGGDQRTAVAAVFSWSVRHLPMDTARIFRLLGLHPADRWDAYATAALANMNLATAHHALDALARAHLVHTVGDGRYAMHDLLRSYAGNLSNSLDSGKQRHDALAQLFDHYLTTAATAMDRLFPAEAHRRPRVGPPATPAPSFTTADLARGWLDSERRTLVTISIYAANHGWAAYSVQMSQTLYRYLDGGYYGDALTLHAHARDAARRIGDLTGQAHAILGLGVIHHRLGRYAIAIDHHRTALALFAEAGDEVGEARALGNLGLVEERLGHYEATTEHHTAAQARYRHANDRVGEAYTLMHLGLVEQRQGRYRSALVRLEHALELFRRVSDPTGEAYTLNNLGNVEERLGRLTAATDHHEHALQLFRSLGHRFGQALTLDGLGVIYNRLGKPHRATEFHQHALAIFTDLGDPDCQAGSFNGLGEAARAAGQPRRAIEYHTSALTLAMDTGTRDQQARAQTGLRAAQT
jgi:tetratricopeptide (TPR) repeat protein